MHALWRRKWLFLVILVSIPVAVYLISTHISKTYQATALVRVQTVTTDVPVVGQGLFDISTESLLVSSQHVAKEAAHELGMPRSSGIPLMGSVTAAPFAPDTSTVPTDLLQLTAQADSATRAADLANAFVRALATVRAAKATAQFNAGIKKLEAQSLTATDSATKAEYAREIAVLRSAESADTTKMIQEATPPATPISPHPRRNTALALMVSLMLALVAVFVRERFDRRLQDSAELEPLLGASLLSVIPRAAFPGERPKPGPVREAFRTLASSLVYFNLEQPIATVIVASPTKGDGKTTVAVYLALALADDGHNVVLVDCDLRNPQVSVRLGIEPSAGLTEVIAREVELREALTEVDVGDRHLRVLASGKRGPNSGRLLGSMRMDSVLTELCELADIVILDTPPILTVSDAVPLLERVSGVILVGKVGVTTRDALQRSRQVVDTAQGKMLGVVATGGAAAGLYGYGADYYAEDSPADKRAASVNGAASVFAQPAEDADEVTQEANPKG